MALQIWMPLNGDAHNQGLTEISTVGSPTFVSGGILGYAFGNNSLAIPNFSVIPCLKDGHSFTFCFWVKPTTASQTVTLFECGNTTGTGTRLHFAMNSNKFRFGFRADDLDGPTLTTSWAHIACVYDGSKKYIYYNGTLSTSATSGQLKIPATNMAGNFYCSTVYMNDFRLYDTALSPKEVELISRGLVLHYPLNHGGFGQNNLLSRYVSPGQQVPGATATQGRTNYYGDYGIIIPATENADTYFRLFLKQQLVQNETYTISCNVSGLLNGTVYRFPLFAQGNTSMGLLELNHNGLCSLTFTMTYSTQSAATIGSETVYICFMDDSSRTIASGQGAITVTNFKIEKGSVATPWTPASTDARYTSLGLNSNIEYDISGYKNNATLSGTYSWTSDTPRYYTSIQTTNNTYGVFTSPFSSTHLMNEMTIALWIKKNFTDTTQRSVFVGPVNIFIYDSNKYRLSWKHATSASSYAYNTSDMGIVINNNVWTHVVITFKNGYLKSYVNGQYFYNSDRTSTGQYILGNMGSCIGASSNAFIGNISDIRFYTTCLTDAQIKELYNTSASLADNGTLLSYEFVEGGA